MHNISVIGLGYVGLPLAVELAKHYKVVGFDIFNKRISELKDGLDRTLEVSKDKLEGAKVQFTSNSSDMGDSNIYIVTVPTPINTAKQPDLTPLEKASEMIGKILKKNDIVIYESTVFPGCTEEICVPILEKYSGLKYKADFKCGYSPERMNPGDKEKTVKDIVKVTSGTDSETAKTVDDIYKSIVTAGTHMASSIKVAEAAKVIENTQRDINIAFVNELSIIFNKMGLDTAEVLEAAGTKWNFLKFSPGLVGGHCIGVDPYYLTYKAQALGHNPEVILSGRRINDNMGQHVASEVVKLMIKKSLKIKDSKALVMGVTFKENCPDYRNTKVVDIVSELKEFGVNVDCYDPHVDSSDFKSEYGIELLSPIKLPDTSSYDSVILAVSHNEFKGQSFNFDLSRQVIFDIKGILNKSEVDARL